MNDKYLLIDKVVEDLYVKCTNDTYEKDKMGYRYSTRKFDWLNVYHSRYDNGLLSPEDYRPYQPNIEFLTKLSNIVVEIESPLIESVSPVRIEIGDRAKMTDLISDKGEFTPMGLLAIANKKYYGNKKFKEKVQSYLINKLNFNYYPSEKYEVLIPRTNMSEIYDLSAKLISGKSTIFECFYWRDSK